MATIRDVAKRAGVSVATVSRVLNQNGYVNEETERRVRQAMKELNYKPNEVARALFKKTSKTVGLIVPDITNPFFPELVRAVEDVMNIYDYTVILCNSDEKVEKEREYIEVLKQKYVDGVILTTNQFAPEEVEEWDVPIVVLDRPLHERYSSVVADNYEGARLATRHLYEVGCRRIAHIQGPNHVVNAMERFRGYQDEMRALGLGDRQLVIQGNYQLKQAKEAVMAALAEHDMDGIFAGNDAMAVGALKAVQQCGLRVPDDIAIIGYDGIPLTEMTTPELSTVSQPIYEMGAMAARILIKQIEGKPLEKLHYQLPVQLVVRQSTSRRGLT
ncbi:LacI family transcriptional regulator [Geobacillus stearothermophilus]|uniref:LacI family DNA-binding transcriptional regulator n=1 Tax=Geobacillus sp. WSUCF-018B TaxID=2055939 RepID=UPI000C286B10|nr:LacI family DNA-binding transcriptional regulator [Geobacillus sp. WSUCF-018B]PJW16516.1 transcriptional regulator [Geobacillus sp. WSUCF-018B]QHN50549.1 LacI family transcriptional regulator [Geobacillus stearothermophilus]